MSQTTKTLKINVAAVAQGGWSVAVDGEYLGGFYGTRPGLVWETKEEALRAAYQYLLDARTTRPVDIRCV